MRFFRRKNRKPEHVPGRTTAVQQEHYVDPMDLSNPMNPLGAFYVSPIYDQETRREDSGVIEERIPEPPTADPLPSPPKPSPEPAAQPDNSVSDNSSGSSYDSGSSSSYDSGSSGFDSGSSY